MSANSPVCGQPVELDAAACPNCRDPALGINRAPHGYGGPFTAGANMLLADGAVRIFADSVSQETLDRLSNPTDGLEVGDF